LLIEAAHKAIKALDLQSSCAKQLSEIENLNEIIVEENEIICKAIFLTDNSKDFFLTARLKRTSGQEKESIISDIKKMTEVLIIRVEAESGPLKLPQSCRFILLSI
jgi:hypothetical protein